MSPRLPRFTRALAISPMEITHRDNHIIRCVARYRFLRSSQIAALLGGSVQQLLRRLKLLYHHGYLERPRCQLDYYHKGGSHEIVYGLSDKGAALLKTNGFPVRQSRMSEMNRSVGRVQLEHVLLVSQMMIAIEFGCPKRGATLIPDEALSLSGSQPSFRWRADIGRGVTLGVIPDAVFAIEREGRRTCFFLEADRGTMPVIRKNLLQTSMYRKFLAYQATWEQGVHKTRFGFSRFRVLVVTPSEERVKSLVEACSQLERGHGLFLFGATTILARPEGILSAQWQTGKGEVTTLLD
jgi:hypothetical protein